MVGGHFRFMLAIDRHCCPAELQGQQNQQKDRHPLFHTAHLTGVEIISQCPVFLRGDSNAVVFESPTPPKNDAFGPEQVIYTISTAPPQLLCKSLILKSFDFLDRLLSHTSTHTQSLMEVSFPSRRVLASLAPSWACYTYFPSRRDDAHCCLSSVQFV